MTKVHAAAHCRDIGRQRLGQTIQGLGLGEPSQGGKNVSPVIFRYGLNVIRDGRAP
jgi:hypothetical protein